MQGDLLNCQPIEPANPLFSRVLQADWLPSIPLPAGFFLLTNESIYIGKNMKKKVAVITGSTQGIGRAVAMALLQAGIRVVINSRDETNVRETVASLETFSSDVLGIPADIGQKHQVNDLVEQVCSRWGAIDILVNNAGIAHFVPVLETVESDWDEMIRINLKGTFLCSQAVLPAMIENKSGHIVNILSVAARKTFLNGGAYAASKAGALAFTNVLREEVRQYNICVIAILAGATSTPLWDNLSGDFAGEQMMPPETVARTVLAAVQNSAGMIEEIVLRPLGGDLQH